METLKQSVSLGHEFEKNKLVSVNFREQPLPNYFRQNIYEISFTVPTTPKKAFDWLLKKKTFTRGQFPPYKVEFIPKNKDPFMKTGDYTTHHGPFIQFAGVMTEVTDRYRRLDYMYGSYAISFRFFRPLCLEVSVENYDTSSNKEKALIKLKLTTGVHKYLNGLWSLMMNFFWPQFAINAKVLWWFKNLFKVS